MCRKANRKAKTDSYEKSLYGNGYRPKPTYHKKGKLKSLTEPEVRPNFALFAVLLFIAVIALIVIAGIISAKNPNSSYGSSYVQQSQASYSFRDSQSLEEHYYKHGQSMGFSSPEDYEVAAVRVIQNPNSLKKTEAEDGDYVYYLQSTNEIVFVSPGGTIKTYFKPDDGIAYFNRQ